MIGLGFVLALVLYVVVALAATVWVPRYLFEAPRARTIASIIVLLTFILIPTWDIIPGRLYFDHLCKTEAGLKIYKTVEGVEGFLAQDPSIVREALERDGFKYIETRAASGGFVHYSLDEGGRLRAKNIVQSSSRYVQRSERADLTASVQVFTETIVDTLTKENLSIRTQFAYSGNWIQRNVSPFLGGGEWCSHFPDQKLFLKTLKPVTNSNKAT